jgi:phage terminase large subunit
MLPDEIVTCDSAEPKSISDWKSYGAYGARPVKKEPDSINYSMKWLQSLNHIYIDPNRCPETLKEFVEYEYERDKEDEVISGYPDANNHSIDAVRYATSKYWVRRGQ